MRALFAVALLPLLAASSARAGTLVSEKTSKPYPGVSLTARVESGPNNHIWIAKVSLCSTYVHVDATKAPSSTQTPASWGNGIGAQLATNGDFYTGTQVYGDAVGGGVPWPLAKTGKDKTTAWYYDHYGWIAFGPDWVEFNHTERTKTVDASKFGIGLGFKPTEVSHAIPKGTLALVSGFPELVIEGQVYTCSSPTASSCFPDRTDMRARHPRTAMGITKDRKTFILVVVDGRTTASAGMYGSELAELMGKVGAWEAFNLDGGGSSSMWLKSQGTVNNASGNNLGNGVRAVANHWGVFAGAASGKPSAPGSCFVPGGCYATPLPGAEAEVFKDMPPGSLGHDAAISLYDANITSGCSNSPLMFCPSCTLSRAQAVTLLVRAAGIDTSNPPATPTFTDVPKTNTFYAAIEAAVKAGITKGCGATTFCPDDPVTRGQLAAFIVRTLGWPTVNPTTPSFPADVPTTHLFYKSIETLKDKCVTNGCAAGKFCPEDDATRAEAAIFIASAFDLDDANPCLGPTGSGGNGGSGGGSSGATGSGGAAGSGGTVGSGGGVGSGGTVGGGGSGASGGSAGSGLTSGGSPTGGDDSGGCGCRTPSAPARPFPLAILAALAVLWRRKRHE